VGLLLNSLRDEMQRMHGELLGCNGLSQQKCSQTVPNTDENERQRFEGHGQILIPAGKSAQLDVYLSARRNGEIPGREGS